jgi:hypothetical protein
MDNEQWTMTNEHERMKGERESLALRFIVQCYNRLTHGACSRFR